VVDKVALGQVFLPVIPFFPVSIVPPLLHIHLSPPHEVCGSSEQAAHCHTFSPKLGASSQTRHLPGKKGMKMICLVRNEALESINEARDVTDIKTDRTGIHHC
jgi:hypothetical protein